MAGRDRALRVMRQPFGPESAYCSGRHLRPTLRLREHEMSGLETTGLAAVNALRPKLGTQEQFRIPTSDSLDSLGM